MKKIFGLSLLSFLLQFCSVEKQKFKAHLTTLNNNHSPMFHKMEKILGKDAASEDSLTSASANKFLNTFETNFNSFQPDKKIMVKLFALPLSGLKVKTIGGNWCSDTRYLIPRFCKVLHQLGIKPEQFDYYTVGKDKKALNDDFAKTQKVEKVPLIIVYNNDIEIGRIVENPIKTIEVDLYNMLTSKK